jgi:8-oxo-dGTP pyrophosphatase MutT (NUDIX family)/phosphohistidine phosphatase SixA
VVELTTVVHSAGGVVWRRSPGGTTEIVLVHRPRYDDWSLPKGKLDPGEHRLTAAVREVGEETAVTASPEARLPTIRYLTGQPGVEKVVDFWSMKAEVWTDRPPDDEIEEIKWVPAASAGALLSYAHDRGVVKAFVDMPKVTAVVGFVRHAKAGKKGEWPGPDNERPLEDRGRHDAAALCGLLALFRPVDVVSATPVRCRQTVEPLGLPVRVDVTFDRDSDPAAGAAALRDVARNGRVAVVCSQGELMPPALVALTGRTNLGFHTPKGSGWMIPFAGDRPIGHDFLRP